MKIATEHLEEIAKTGVASRGAVISLARELYSMRAFYKAAIYVHDKERELYEKYESVQNGGSVAFELPDITISTRD